MVNKDAEKPKVFDLKGSWNNRIVTDNSGKQTMKDRNLLNLIKKSSGNGILQFEKSDIVEINKHIKLDSEFLQSKRLMDYSLLLAIEKVKNKSPI